MFDWVHIDRTAYNLIPHQPVDKNITVRDVIFIALCMFSVIWNHLSIC